MDELKQARLSVGVHVAAAALVGWASYILSLTYTKWVCALLGFGVLALVSFVFMKKFKVNGKWLSGNGTFIYIFVWAVAWILAFNMAMP